LAPRVHHLDHIVLDSQSASRRAPRAAGPAPYELAILSIDVHLLADRAGKPAFAYFHVRSLGRWPPALAVARAATTDQSPIVPPTQRPIKSSIPPPRNPISPAVNERLGQVTEESVALPIRRSRGRPGRKGSEGRRQSKSGQEAAVR
jgi:hypothetical protein